MKQEYIVGDVVEYYDKIMAIRELEDIKCVGLSSSKEKIIRCYAPIWQLKPVQLSTIILKYNGWDVVRDNIVCKWVTEEQLSFLRTLEDDNWAFKGERPNLKITIISK